MMDGLTYGARPCKKSGSRKRKGASDYAAENEEDFTYKAVQREGRNINVLVCKFCAVVIGARSDRIKEHLASKRHLKLKKETMEAGQSTSTLSVINARNQSIAFGNGQLAEYEEDDAEDLNTYDISTAPSTPSPTSQNGLAKDLSTRNGSLSGSNRLDLHDVSINFNKLSSNKGYLNILTSGQLPTPSVPFQKVAERNTMYCVSWNGSLSVMKTAFSAYQVGGTFTDVTIACDGKTLKCHKLVLSACSDYFFKLLRDTPCSHPIVILKDTPFWELEALVKFMYDGEVYVKKDQLKSLVKTANQLQIRGLSCNYHEIDKASRTLAAGNSSYPTMAVGSIGPSSGNAMLMPEPPTASVQTDTGLNGHYYANGMGNPKPLQYFPHMNGGVCHESSPMSLLKKATGLKTSTTNGELSNSNQGWININHQQFSSMHGNSMQQERSKNRNPRKRAHDSGYDPQITISKIPDVARRSRSYQDNQPGAAEGNMEYLWKNLIPQVEIQDSEESTSQHHDSHNGVNYTLNNNNFPMSEDETDSDDSQKALTIAEDN